MEGYCLQYISSSQIYSNKSFFYYLEKCKIQIIVFKFKIALAIFAHRILQGDAYGRNILENKL